MTEPQVWTLIGVFAAVMLGGMTLMTTLLAKTLDARFEGLQGEMNARFDAVSALFDAVGARFDTVNTRLEKIERTVDHLDDEVSALAKHVWGT